MYREVFYLNYSLKIKIICFINFISFTFYKDKYQTVCFNNFSLKATMKQRIYIDTSVFGGYFDMEFEKYTIPFFERIKNKEK